MSEIPQPPKGTYKARAIKKPTDDYEIVSQTKGTPGYAFDVRIEEGDHAGYVAPWQSFVSKDNLARTVEQLELAGAKVLPDGSVDWSGLGSKVFPASFSIDEYSGDFRCNWINGPFRHGKLTDPAKQAEMRSMLAGALAARGTTDDAGKGGDKIPF